MWSLQCGCAVGKVVLMHLRILCALFCTDQYRYRSRMVKFVRLLALPASLTVKEQLYRSPGISYLSDQAFVV